MAVYLAGVVLFGVRLIRGGIGARRVARAAVRVHVAPGGGPHPIYESAQIITPVTVGLLWPRILLPAAWRTWTRDQLAAVVAHEAAHAARRDPLVAFVAQVNRALFWCHPLAWWLPRTLAAMAEDVCDAAGVDAAGTREQYAEVLLSFARVVQHQGGRLAWHGSGVAGYGSLTDRIERVLDGRPLVSTSRRRSLAIAGCAVTAVCLAAGVEGRVPTPLQADTITPPAPALTVDDALTADDALIAAPAAAPPAARPRSAALSRSAQAYGSIEGVVHDASGLPVPMVDVILGEPPTEIVQSTDALGRYAFYNVTLGTYRLRFQLPGFKTLVRPQVAVTPGLQALATAVLEVGSLTETLEIGSREVRSLSRPSTTAANTSADESVLLAALAAAPDEPRPYLDLVRFYDAAGRAADAERLSRRAQDLMRARQAPASAGTRRTGGDITPPLAVRHVPPVYPASAVGSRGGVVILEGRISSDGAIQSAKVLRSVPAFDAAALTAFEQWLYTPALLNGAPVEVGVTVTMNFREP